MYINKQGLLSDSLWCLKDSAKCIIPGFFLFVEASRQTDASGPAQTSKSLGSFYHLPSYLKLYDVLKATYANYKVCKSPGIISPYQQVLAIL